MKKLIGFTVLVCLCVELYAQQQVFDKNKLLLAPFEYNEVKLLDSPLKHQFDEVVAYYLAIPDNDLLKGFRQRAGLPTYGARDLGGWYTNDIFHVFGQFLSGMSRLYAVSGNQALKNKVNFLVEEWAKTIDANGYFFYSSKPNAPHYVYEKMVGGLVDAYVFAGDKNALKQLSIITDWAVKNLNRDRIYGQTQSEWYTLSENLYRAYCVTGDKKYLDFGKIWEYTDYWNYYLTGVPPVGERRHHAYSHLNTLSSAAAAYLVSGNEKYKTIIKNAYNFFWKEQCFATGGFGPDERLLPKNELIKTLETTHNTFETQCGSWAIFKLSKYLIMITGDARYGDWIEKMTMNGIGANISMSPDGRVQYYSDYNPREGTRHNHHVGWTCCTGTRPEAVAEYTDMVYFKNNDGLYVNLYTPSYATWHGISVTQQTNFPENNISLIKLNVKKGGIETTLSFRKPLWAETMPVISVNGKAIKPKLVNNWMQIKRLWLDNDQVKITFPMKLYIDRLDGSKPYPAAFMYGPVAMAVNASNPYPEDIVVSKSISEQFIPISGKPLNYRIKNHSDLILRPYYQFSPNEAYTLYIDSVVKNIVLQKDLVYNGDWKQGRGPIFSNEKGASISTTFTGTGIKVYLDGYRNSGKAQIIIDGKGTDVIDTFNASANGYKPGSSYLEKQYSSLAVGTHKMVLLVLDEKNPQSKGTFVNVVKFEVLP
ncbi:beta-L-arabinofuranosidase domain-containing protein [Pedobacter sp. BS3]|uniref:beta-L-arabinofuranosidase domain-containing protein n=1 Tax=Pedobacter sp. BS3 TaxID=2567937 RepID=UPI001658CEA3|nr:beta-L-arabinofuranosidase domain-containing protein [Pedobacter sp. BS3]